MMTFYYLGYILTFFFIANWLPILLFISSLGKPKQTVRIVKDKKIFTLLKHKTRLRISSIKILNSNRLFGMMIGIPGRPILILSKSLYQTFTKNELEYVVLHEAGHYILGHTIKLIIEQIFLIIVGVLLIKFFFKPGSLIFFSLLALFMGIVSIQIARMFEYEADGYALEKISDSKGMIDATKKFKQASIIPFYAQGIFGKLFVVSIPYAKRIMMVKNT